MKIGLFFFGRREYLEAVVVVKHHYALDFFIAIGI